MQNNFRNLEKAVCKLKEALCLEPDEYIRDSVIKRFEISFELLWKLIKRIADSENLECYSPKSCLKLAYQMGLIKDEEIFLSILEYRNLLVHTYNEFEAENVYNFVKQKGLCAFQDILSELGKKI